MEGQEISEIPFSTIVNENDWHRIDPEYYRKDATQLIARIQERPHVILGEHFDVSKLAGFEFTEYFTPVNMNTSDSYIALTSKNIQCERLDLTEYITIEKKIADTNLQRSKILHEDVILSYTGEYRRALVMQDFHPYQLGPNICRIRATSGVISPYFLSCFLNSKIGQKILDREKTLSAQPTVAMSRIRQILIPISDVQDNIRQLLRKSYCTVKESNKLYNEAETILQDALGLHGWHPQKENVNVKSFKDSFGVSGRLDSEYYQPKYDELFVLLSKFECDTISNIANIKKSVEPGSDAYKESGIPFVRVSDMTKYGIEKPNIYLSPDDFDVKELQPKRDTILLSKDGSVGIAYKVEEDKYCVTSGALLHLSVFNKNYLPDYVTLVLNSIIVQMQAERDANGAIIQHWKPSEIEQVLIPKIPMYIQESIASKLQESFALKAESKRLLDEAKIMVEMEIERM